MLAVLMLSVLSATLLCVAVTVSVMLIRSRKKEDALSDSIEEFLYTGRFTPLSVADDRFSKLQNGVCDLEVAINAEKNRHEADNKLNCDFVADVSHQLKTPLAGMKLYGEMLNEEYPCEYTDNIVTLIQKTERLVAELLKLQKLKADAFDFTFEPISLRSVFEELKSDILPVFPGKRIFITGDAVKRIDRMWFLQAAGNVIKNACEYTGEDGVIEIDIQDNAASVFVTFKDNGGGVPEECIDRLFDRFNELSASSSQSTGLGLAITKAIVEKHHGTVSAENCGGGLKITMCIPKIDGMEE